MSIHEFKVLDIKKNEVDLSKYKGSIVLIVNVASQCIPNIFKIRRIYLSISRITKFI